jgi:hypothetical protein
MNAISAIFCSPDDAQDVRAIDTLEQTHPEEVQAIRETRSAQHARELVYSLYLTLDKDEKQTYPAWLEDWLLRCSRVIGHEEKAGLHHVGAEAQCGVLPPGMNRRGDGQRA